MFDGLFFLNCSLVVNKKSLNRVVIDGKVVRELRADGGDRDESWTKGSIDSEKALQK